MSRKGPGSAPAAGPELLRAAVLLGAALTAACTGRAQTIEGRSLAAIAAEMPEAVCGHMEPLAGRRVHLARHLGAGELLVRPAPITLHQAHWLLDSGWVVERGAADPRAPVRIREDRATLRLPPLPCPRSLFDRWPVSVAFRLLDDGRGAKLGATSVSLASMGGTATRGELSDGAREAVLQSSTADPAQPTEMTIRSDSMGSVGVTGVLLPLGSIRPEVNDEYREAIVASSVRQARFEIVPPPGAVLEFALAVIPAGDSHGGGWRFQISASADSGVQELFDETVASSDSAKTGRWLVRRIDLSAWAGRAIRLALSAARLDGDASLALWGSPVIEAGAATGRKMPPNILLVSVDTLRADRVGRINQGHQLTPALMSLAAEADRFTDCRAQAPSTLCSHASMLTGLLPSANGATSKAELSDAIPYAPDLLSRAGYATVALTDDGLMDGRFGFARGFDAFLNRSEPIERRAEEAVAAMKRLPQPWFLFVHTYQVHAPYSRSPGFTEVLTRGYKGPLGATYDPAVFMRTLSRMNDGKLPATQEDIRHLDDVYDAQVMRTDRSLEKIFDALRRDGLWNRTAILVTGDHGEEFNEHGVLARHSRTCYEELMRVPLIVKLPSGFGAVPRKIDAPVDLIDVAPTLLALAGLPRPETTEGVSLMSLLRGSSAAARDTVCEIDDGRGAAIVRGRWKYQMRARWSVDDPRTYKRRLQTWGRYPPEELYDLARDPGEKDNLVSREPARASELRAALESELASARGIFIRLRASRQKPRQPQEDAEHLERLRSLGYVQ